MGTAANPDEQALAAHAAALADGIEAALPGWVRRSVARLLVAWAGTADASVLAAADEAGARARSELMPELRALLGSDVDAQRQSPLSLLRTAVRYPTSVLRAAGVPPVQRDEFAERAFPADVYDLAPAAFADLDPDLAEVGLVWGAAKAHVVLARRRASR